MKENFKGVSEKLAKLKSDMKKVVAGGGVKMEESPADDKASRDKTPSSAQKRRTN
tara:strand:+ start:164 stop:328 length:165 start_codon:yes stop_codon:yes gene_type:complete